MKPIFLLAVASLFAGAASAQAPELPADIHPVTLSRLPPVTPADLDEEGQKILAARQNFNPAPGPGHIGIYNPKVTEGAGALGRALGIPTGETSRLGPRMFQP